VTLSTIRWKTRGHSNHDGCRHQTTGLAFNPAGFSQHRLMAGVFFAFSTFVMKALARLPIPQGIEAMQSINRTAVSPVFMVAFFGSTVVCVLLAVYSRVLWPQHGALYCSSAACFIWLGPFDDCRVQRALNNALARVDPGSADGARLWARYLTSWPAWNHVRTLSSILASAAYAFALSGPIDNSELFGICSLAVAKFANGARSVRRTEKYCNRSILRFLQRNCSIFRLISPRIC